jgi:hypothetical protein
MTTLQGMNRGMNRGNNTRKTAKNRKKMRLLNKIQQPLTVCRSPLTETVLTDKVKTVQR